VDTERYVFENVLTNCTLDWGSAICQCSCSLSYVCAEICGQKLLDCHPPCNVGYYQHQQCEFLMCHKLISELSVRTSNDIITESMKSWQHTQNYSFRSQRIWPEGCNMV